MIGFKKYKSLD